MVVLMPPDTTKLAVVKSDNFVCLRARFVESRQAASDPLKRNSPAQIIRIRRCSPPRHHPAADYERTQKWVPLPPATPFAASVNGVRLSASGRSLPRRN